MLRIRVSGGWTIVVCTSSLECYLTNNFTILWFYCRFLNLQDNDCMMNLLTHTIHASTPFSGMMNQTTSTSKEPTLSSVSGWSEHLSIDFCWLIYSRYTFSHLMKPSLLSYTLHINHDAFFAQTVSTNSTTSKPTDISSSVSDECCGLVDFHPWCAVYLLALYNLIVTNFYVPLF